MCLILQSAGFLEHFCKCMWWHKAVHEHFFFLQHYTAAIWNLKSPEMASRPHLFHFSAFLLSPWPWWANKISDPLKPCNHHNKRMAFPLFLIACHSVLKILLRGSLQNPVYCETQSEMDTASPVMLINCTLLRTCTAVSKILFSFALFWFLWQGPCLIPSSLAGRCAHIRHCSPIQGYSASAWLPNMLPCAPLYMDPAVLPKPYVLLDGLPPYILPPHPLKATWNPIVASFP